MVLTLTIFVIYIIEFSIGNNTVDINYNDTELGLGLGCPPFDKFENGIISANYHGEFPGTLHVECKLGYDLIGSPKIVCLNGKWDIGENPICEIQCSSPPALINGFVEIEGDEIDDNKYSKGALASYKCEEGFLLSPPDSLYRVCEKGIWTGANATCAPVERITKCRPLRKISNGYYIHEKLDSESFVIGQTVAYFCNSGYRIRGEASQMCLEDGTWAPKQPPSCVPNDDPPTYCLSFPTYPHSFSKVITGFQNYESAIAGTEVEIACIAHYRNTNSPCEHARLRCIAGQWMGIPPNCELVSECRCPPKVVFGSPMLLTPNSFEYEKSCRYPMNSSVSYECISGYELVGSILTCNLGGCWSPSILPVCKPKVETNGEPIVFSLATGAGVLLLLVIACLIIVCRKRKPLSRSVAIPPPVPRADLADHASLLHPPDRLALIAFADGMQVGQSGLPTYEEATRDRNLGITSSRLQRPPWPSVVGRRSRNSPNPDNMLFTRQGSFASHSASTRSGGDPMGSTDTMAVSENSTTVTLDTASSHSGSQPASCRAHCGSLASFDTSSVLNTEGVPLLEESELEEIQCGDTVSLAMENRSMCDNTSYKLSTASDVA